METTFKCKLVNNNLLVSISVFVVTITTVSLQFQIYQHLWLERRASASEKGYDHILSWQSTNHLPYILNCAIHFNSVPGSYLGQTNCWWEIINDEWGASSGTSIPVLLLLSPLSSCVTSIITLIFHLSH